MSLRLPVRSSSLFHLARRSTLNDGVSKVPVFTPVPSRRPSVTH